MTEYRRFCAHAAFDPELAEELRAIEGNEAEIAARFSSELSFGTAGLRGIIGAGTSRMNVYTVSRASAGLLDVITEKKRGERPVFVVGYDTRIKSDLFARRTARVLASGGACVYLAPEPIPVPLVSYACRALSADAGVCITASHNPAAYNGYKVFGEGGGQLLEEEAEAVSRAAEKHDYFEELPEDSSGEITAIPAAVFEAYFSALSARLGREESDLSIVYTPLCGTGLNFVPRALSSAGFEKVSLVEQQAVHDGRFPTCEKPNPEERGAWKLALELAREQRAELVLATDPDCDRVGVAVREAGDYRLLSGNETGLLLLDYLLQTRRASGTLSPDLVVCTTIVSAPMADAICADYGVELLRVLTGFKYIGEQVRRLERAGEAERFLFGFEESYGSLASTDVRDKDACEACTLICRMAHAYRKQGKSLTDVLADLEKRYGVYRNALKSYEFSGPCAKENMVSLMQKLRTSPPQSLAGARVTEISDYLLGVRRTQSGEAAIDLPRSDVLSFDMDNQTRLMVRPSGTEPKVKAYLFSRAKTQNEAQAHLEELIAQSDALFSLKS